MRRSSGFLRFLKISRSIYMTKKKEILNERPLILEFLGFVQGGREVRRWSGFLGFLEISRSTHHTSQKKGNPK